MTILSTNTKTGDNVTVRCVNSNKILTGRVVYSGPSSTPRCWVVQVKPDSPHCVATVSRAWDLSKSPTHNAIG